MSVRLKIESFSAAQDAYRKGDLNRCFALCEAVLTSAPDFPPAVLLSGIVETRRGRFVEAVPLLSRALELSPRDYLASLWLPIALRGAGRPHDAIRAGEAAKAIWPSDGEILENLALDYYNVKDYASAESCLRTALRAAPDKPSLHRKLGSLLEHVGRDAEAADAYRRMVKTNPTDEAGYAKLGRMLIGHGNFVQAIEAIESGLERLPNSAQLHLILAQALRGVGDLDRANERLNRAIELDPQIVLAAALWLNEDGRFREADELFRRSIALNPRQGVAYFGLVRGRRMGDDEEELLNAMRSLTEDANLPPKEKAALLYGLGKAADDRGRYEEAIGYFDAGNALKHQIYLSGVSFDPEAAKEHWRKTRGLMTTQWLRSNRRFASDSNVPIFIVGMIRSGTSLLEQIVASHPDVGGAGEQRFIVTEFPNLVDLDTGTIDEERLLEARDRYLRVLTSFQPDASRITDKMPMNFYHAGLIHLLYPRSPILHIRRNPVDTALSIYMTDLAKPPEFAHDRANIVAAYRLYEEVMSYWREVLPPSAFFEVRYEDLVADQEFWTRKILEFCGLPWNEACLSFHRNDRAVSTPSMWQVRQPIYRTSVEKWRHYEPWLGAFNELRQT